MIRYWHEGVPLLAPTSYVTATESERALHCNGMGPKGMGFLVPDTMYLQNMEEAGKIHDWMYTFPEGKTQEVCDKTFLSNMYTMIEYSDSWGWVKWLKKRRAYKYYYSVKLAGSNHFSEQT